MNQSDRWWFVKHVQYFTSWLQLYEENIQPHFLLQTTANYIVHNVGAHSSKTMTPPCNHRYKSSSEWRQRTPPWTLWHKKWTDGTDSDVLKTITATKFNHGFNFNARNMDNPWFLRGLSCPGSGKSFLLCQLKHLIDCYWFIELAGAEQTLNMLSVFPSGGI